MCVDAREEGNIVKLNFSKPKFCRHRVALIFQKRMASLSLYKDNKKLIKKWEQSKTKRRVYYILKVCKTFQRHF